MAIARWFRTSASGRLRLGFALLILIVAAVFFRFARPHRWPWVPEKPTVFRIALPRFRSLKGLDPANVQTHADANLVRNLYGRLVEFDNDGNLVGSLAQRFDWVDGDIVFRLQPNLHTVDGWPITVNDAAFSLRRLVMLDRNTHGDLKSLLCPRATARTLAEACSGIRVDHDRLVLHPADARKASFLLPLLASPDFSVLPQAAVDTRAAEMPIRDYRNTSGAYYVEQDDEQGRYLWRANVGYPHYSADIPAELQFVPAQAGEMPALFREHKIDLITTIAPPKLADVEALHVDQPDTEEHRTMNIKLWQVAFTQRGRLELTRQQRIAIGRVLRERYLRTLDQGAVPTIELSPALGEGRLETAQIAQLQRTFATEGTSTKIPAGVIFGVSPSTADAMRALYQEVPEFKFDREAQPPWTLPLAEQPHFYITFTDSAFNESLSLLSYNIRIGSYGVSAAEGERWLEKYTTTEDQSARFRLSRELHFRVLNEAFIVPLVTVPYVALVRKPWHFEFSTLFAGTPLWRIHRQG